MQLRIRLLSLALLAPSMAFAWPVIDRPVPTGTYPIKVYPDDRDPATYWYIPISIDPWTRDQSHQSSLYRKDGTLSFVFRGQASVGPEVLESVAKSIGTSVARLTPISYEYSKDLICQNFYADDPKVSWQFPKAIGNYLEIVPISLRVNGDRELADEIHSLILQGGFGCTVSVGFKGVSTAFRVEVQADLNRVYDRFESHAQAKAFFWEYDVHTLVESLRREGAIRITSLEDVSIPPSELDRKIEAAMDRVTQLILTQLFEQSLKLPTEPIAGRGKPFSLRLDYRHSSENSKFSAILEGDRIQIKDSTLSIRMGL